MISHFSPSDDTLARYLSGELPMSDRLSVEQWLAEHPTRRALISRMAAVWDEPRFALEAWDRDQLVQRFVATQKDASHKPGSRRSMFRVWWRRPAMFMVAAVVPIVVIIGVLVWPELSSPVGGASSSENWTHVTSAGQRATVSLSDGTLVTLAPGSRFRRSERFGAESRNIELDGEAYFTVAAMNDVPFTVKTSAATIQVLGTAFSVRGYRGEHETHVAVTQGRVSAIPTGGTSSQLSAGDVVTMRSDGTIHLVQDDWVAVERATEWRNGRLEFYDLPLSDVARRLARWYDLKIDIEDPVLASRRISATFYDEVDSAVLQAIADALGARVVRNNRHVTFLVR